VRRIAPALLLAALSGLAAAQPVAFLEKPPVIDGLLDKDLAHLPARTFAAAEPSHHPTYRLAYGAGFLYLFIEVDADSIVQRDRAYQNGDGFHMVIARPKPGGEPSDEFYVLGFSAGNPASKWQKQFVWYRNIELGMKLLAGARIAAQASPGKTGIELLLPWSDVYPFHPWLSDGIGFNLCFVKAVGDTQKSRFLALYDPRIDSEQSMRRYIPLEFAPPKLTAGAQAYAILERNHVSRGEPVRIQVAAVAAANTSLDFAARISSGEGTRLPGKSFQLQAGPAVQRAVFPIPAADLPSGGYSVTWDSAGETDNGALGLSILNPFDSEAEKARIQKLEDKLKPGSVTTLRFQLDQIQQLQRTLKPYDVATSLRFAIDEFQSVLAAAEKGDDSLAARKGLLRRAYRSRVAPALQRAHSCRILERQTLPLARVPPRQRSG
jgi:hypothetical protein